MFYRSDVIAQLICRPLRDTINNTFRFTIALGLQHCTRAVVRLLCRTELQSSSSLIDDEAVKDCGDRDACGLGARRNAYWILPSVRLDLEIRLEAHTLRTIFTVVYYQLIKNQMHQPCIPDDDLHNHTVD